MGKLAGVRRRPRRVDVRARGSAELALGFWEEICWDRGCCVARDVVPHTPEPGVNPVVKRPGDEEEESELVVEALTRNLLEIRGCLGLWDVRWVVISLLDDWTRPALERINNIIIILVENSLILKKTQYTTHLNLDRHVRHHLARHNLEGLVHERRVPHTR